MHFMVAVIEDDAELTTNLTGLVELSGSWQSKISFGKTIGRKAVGRLNRATLDVEDNAPLLDQDYWVMKFTTAPFGPWKFDVLARFGDVADKNVLDVAQIKEISPVLNYRVGSFEFGLETIFREVKLDGTRLYKERWYTLKTFWRPNEKMSHRLLYLDDLAEQDIDRLPDKNVEVEVDRTLEYTFTYRPNETWSLLTGAKGDFDDRSDKMLADWVGRQVYLKLEYRF